MRFVAIFVLCSVLVAATSDHFLMKGKGGKGKQQDKKCKSPMANCLSGDKYCTTNLYTDANNCGGCFTVCPSTMGTAACASGECGYSACNAPYALRNGNQCVDTDTTTDYCGASMTDCNAIKWANSAASCVAGACVFTCDTGYAECQPGTCISTESTTAHCGSCQNDCTALTPSDANADQTSGSCSSGSCVYDCNAGFDDCEGNGCEDITASNTHCGECDSACEDAFLDAQCTAEVCVKTCPSSAPTDCDATDSFSCVDTNTDVNHCGGCNSPCSPATGQDAACNSGSCAYTCSSGFTECATVCVDTQINADNCNTCGNACPDPANGQGVCNAGSCGFTCDVGFTKCGSACVDTTTDTAHCGACDAACPTGAAGASGSATCASGVCGGLSCDAGLSDCNGDLHGAAGNGCEVSTADDEYNCGSCDGLCGYERILGQCTGGSCTLPCQVPYLDCDGVASTGCEVDSRSSSAHCGSCNNACGATQTCMSSTCQENAVPEVHPAPAAAPTANTNASKKGKKKGPKGF